MCTSRRIAAPVIRVSVCTRATGPDPTRESGGGAPQFKTVAHFLPACLLAKVLRRSRMGHRAMRGTPHEFTPIVRTLTISQDDPPGTTG